MNHPDDQIVVPYAAWKRLIALDQAVSDMADMLDGFDIGSETFTQFTCSETEQIREVLILAGHAATADRILFWHAEGDDTDDEHGNIADLIRSVQ